MKTIGNFFLMLFVGFAVIVIAHIFSAKYSQALLEMGFNFHYATFGLIGSGVITSILKE